MKIRKIISDIQLSPGDRVVAAILHRDQIVVVTERGAFYIISPEENDHHG